MRPLTSIFLLLITAFVGVFPAQSQDIQSSRNELLNRGITLYEQGFFEESIQKFDQFKSENPNSEFLINADFYKVRALAGSDSSQMEFYYETFILKYPGSELAINLQKDLGHRFTKNRNYEAAISYYNKALGTWIKKERIPETMYWVADDAIENHDYGMAKTYFLELANTYPKSKWAPKALYTRGRLYLDENEYDSSSVAFELLKERYPNDPITRRVGTALGESYYQQTKYAEAITALNNAMPYLDSLSQIKAVFLIAESHNYLGDYQSASTSYLRYINLTKGTERERPAHYGLGWLYNKQGIYHWAAQSFAKATDGDDELARKALYYQAVNEKLAGQYENSIESFREFGRRYKSGLWVEEGYYEWAMSAFESGQYEESIETLLTLVRNQKALKDGGKVYTLLGEAYFANNEFTRALYAFDEAGKSTDIDPAVKRQAQFQKAWIQFRNQAFEQAQPIFEEIYKDDPKSELGSEALFWSADCFYQLEEYDQAASRFQTFINSYKKSELVGAARYSLGWSYFKNGEYEKAVKPLEDFLKNYNPPSIALFPYDIDTKLRLGDAYYALGKYETAIAYYEQAIGAEPGGDYALFQIGNSYYRKEDTFEAVTTFRRLLRIYPYSSIKEQAQYNIAYIYLNTGNYTQAVTEFQTVINKYPGTEWAARAQYNIGDAYYNAGEYKNAVSAYKKVLDNYPRSRYIIEAINGIQYAQLSSSGNDSSSQVLQEFLGDNPQSTTADRLRFRQAENIFQSGDYESAIREFRQYLRITNSDDLVPESYFYLGESYRQIGQIDKAIDAYNSVVNDFSKDEQAAAALTSLGLIYYNKGDYQSSYNSYNQLLKNWKRFSQEAYIGMGDANLAQNKLDEAREMYDKALGINATNVSARVGIGKVALAHGNFEEAELILYPLAVNNTTEVGAEAQYYLGKIKQDQGLYEEAIASYSKVKVLFETFDSWVSRAMYGIAECQILSGKKAEGIKTLREIRKKYPGTEAAAKAKVLMD